MVKVGYTSLSAGKAIRFEKLRVGAVAVEA
jgi:hypothetical protein